MRSVSSWWSASTLLLGLGTCVFAPMIPRIQPFLNYNYFEEEFDLKRLREGVRIANRFGEHEGWANLVTERVEPMDSDMESDDSLERLDQRDRRDQSSCVWHMQDGARDLIRWLL